MEAQEKKYFKELKKIEKIFDEFSKIIFLNFPKPKNLQKEKKIFFSKIANGETYNPQIKYDKKSIDLIRLRKLRERVDNISIKNDLYGFKQLYKERMEAKFIQIEYHLSWGTSKSSKKAIKYWKKPSYALVLKAKKFCKNYKRETVKFTTLTPRIAGNTLKKEVLELTGNKIKLKYGDLASKVNIESSEGVIELNKNERFTSLDVERLKAHEIGVHYLRYFNATKFKIKLLETGTCDYLETEEGLAAYNEYKQGVLSNAQMFVYAGRVLATHYSLKKSFYEIYQILKKYGFADKIAFAITFRAKRNLSDTSQKGGFPKDYVYFKGFFKVKNFAKKNDVCDLFIGKIKIDDIKVLKKFINKNKANIFCPDLIKKD